MRFLTDENVDVGLTDHLVALGHDAKAVGRDYVEALTDEDVLALAVSERRVLITNDKGFGELIFRRGLPHAGVLLFRTRSETLAAKIRVLDRALAQLEPGELEGIVVLAEQGARLRRAPSI